MSGSAGPGGGVKLLEKEAAAAEDGAASDRCTAGLGVVPVGGPGAPHAAAPAGGQVLTGVPGLYGPHPPQGETRHLPGSTCCPVPCSVRLKMLTTPSGAGPPQRHRAIKYR